MEIESNISLGWAIFYSLSLRKNTSWGKYSIVQNGHKENPESANSGNFLIFDVYLSNYFIFDSFFEFDKFTK